MTENRFDDVMHLIAAVNAARGWTDGTPETFTMSVADAERRLEIRFGTSRALAVYGTLAPGRQNHHVVAPLGGEWSDGIIEGDLSPEGWGATLGYPAFRPRVGGAEIRVHLLTAPGLTAAWPGLDRFEGPGYKRILVPVFRPGSSDERQPHMVANIYAAASDAPRNAGR
jgi:gamma-glutamylcyclotransferase (GGCT)/AIG2-like uncharacterized protein YtfP